MTLQQELDYWNDLYFQEITKESPNQEYAAQLNDYRKECIRELNGESIIRTRPTI